MLSDADLDLALRSPLLPGVRLLLDDEALGTRLAEGGPAGTLVGIRRRYLRFKPGVNLLAAYDALTPSQSVPVYAKAYRAGQHLSKLEKSERRPSLPGPLGEGRRQWPDAAAEVCVFPNDNKLSTLRLLFHPDRQRSLLRKLGLRLDPEHPPAIDLLAYKPERRLIARFGVAAGSTAVVRAYAEAGFTPALRAAGAFRSVGSLRVPGLIGALARRHLLAVEWIPGHPLTPCLEGPEALSTLLRVGTALAEFHGQTGAAVHLPAAGAAPGLAQTGAGPLAFLRPGRTDSIRALAEELDQGAAEGAGSPVPLHGDFHARQVLVCGDSIAILDLDQASRGDPAEDLGNFAAHLEADALRGRLRSAIAPLVGALCEGYRRRGSPVTDAAVRFHTARSLFALAPHFFRSAEPEWPRLTDRCLDRIRELLPSGKAVGPRSSPADRARMKLEDQSDLQADPAFEPFLDAIRPAQAEEALRRALACRHEGAGGAGARLRSLRVLRHKTGRRALIEYRLSAPHAANPEEGEWVVLGKIRVRGLDARAAAALAALRDAGFDDASPDGISVPEPCGAVPRLHLWLQRRAPGDTLTDWLAGPRRREACCRAAEAIAKLHQAPVVPERRHGHEDELAILRDRLEQMIGSRPQLAGPVRQILARCLDLGRGLPAHPPVPIHRDFHPDQLVWDGARVWLLDLDLLALGDPHLDVGNFLGHLVELALRRHGSPDALADCEAAFLRRYRECRPMADPQSIRRFTELTLARHIFLSTQIAGRGHLTESLVALCADRLAEVARPGTPAGPPAASEHHAPPP